MSTAIEKTDPQLLEKLAAMLQNAGESSTYNSQIATSFIKWAEANTNLISPAMACPNMPLGFELAFTKVMINPDPRFKEVYKQSDGGLSLTKIGLEKIQKGAGIRLDPRLTRKLDNGADPLFAVYEFVGHYRDFDGTICPVKGTKELDLHDDSAEIQKIRGRQRSEAAGNNEINELRRFISGHAESKARLRGIRSFGIKSSYTEEELKKPFTCIRLIRTGRCEDPATQLMLTKMIHEEYQVAEQSLFGGRPQISSVGVEPAALNPAPESVVSKSYSGGVDSPMPGFMDSATAETSAPEPKACTPDQCFGKGSKHVRACSEPIETESAKSAEQVVEKKTTEIVDPVMKALSAQLDAYVSELEREDLSQDQVTKIKAEMKQVEAAIEARRKA